MKYTSLTPSRHYLRAAALKCIGVFPVLARTPLFRKIVYPKGVVNFARDTHLPPIDVDVANTAPQEISGVDGREWPGLPRAAYLSLRIEAERMLIAEFCEEKISTYEKTFSSTQRADEIMNWLRVMARERHLQFIAASIQAADKQLEGRLKGLFSRFWLQEDIVPFVLPVEEGAPGESLEEQVRAVVAHFDKQNIVHVQLNEDREVQVAELVTLEDYQRITSPEDFALLVKLARAFMGKRLAFINATPRGGGVALMRHALIRLLRLLGVDAHWYILIPNKEAFDITKPKFHNVLQAVASPDTVLGPEDKAIYEAWMQENARALEPVFRQTDVVVIDDPQPAGLIPYIRQVNANAKIIYRSHIQIVGSLASQEGTPQHATWSFLWEKIREADYFISHPIREFVPAGVPDEKVFYMPATTDPLDGLNKPLSQEQLATYVKIFNQMLIESGQEPLDTTRQCIVQIARFDPSKGIPDVLEAYYKLRNMLESQLRPVPQLIIAGNGSVDDPDGVPVYNLVMQLLQSEPYASFASDVKVMRLPHKDQVLDTLLRVSQVVLQLSIREGFEVKVTEALMKGKPVVAYRAGGIPLQILDGINGHLVEVGDTAQVAQHLYTLLTDAAEYERMSRAAADLADTGYLTVPNATCWLYLALQLVRGRKLEGNHRWVLPLAHDAFKEEPQVSSESGPIPQITAL